MEAEALQERQAEELRRLEELQKRQEAQVRATIEQSQRDELLRHEQSGLLAQEELARAQNLQARMLEDSKIQRKIDSIVFLFFPHVIVLRHKVPQLLSHSDETLTIHCLYQFKEDKLLDALPADQSDISASSSNTSACLTARAFGGAPLPLKARLRRFGGIISGRKSGFSDDGTKKQPSMGAPIYTALLHPQHESVGIHLPPQTGANLPVPADGNIEGTPQQPQLPNAANIKYMPSRLPLSKRITLSTTFVNLLQRLLHTLSTWYKVLT